MTTHYEKIQALGNRMASNLETMGVSASFSDGGLTLADKILQIQHFTDGLLLWADKDIIQTGDTVNFCALLLDDGKAVSGETIFFYDSNNPPITRSSTQTHTLNVELGSSFKLIYQSSSTYGESIKLSNEDDSLLIQYSGYDNNIYISINGGIPVTAFSCEGFLKLENGVLSDDGGHTYNLSSYNLNFKLKEMQTVGNNCSVYINPIGSAVTDANGVASVTYTGVGAGNLNVQAKTIDGRLQSETYGVLDCLMRDGGVTGDKNITDWANLGLSSSITFNENVTSDGTVLEYSSTGGERNLRRYVNKLITGDFEILITVKSRNPSSEILRLYLMDSNTSPSQTKRWRINNDTFTDYKITRNEGTITCYRKVNDEWVTVSSESGNLTSEDCYFAFQFYTTSATTRELTYKNLQIYPV